MEPNLDFPRISMTTRWVLLPFMFVWWCFQIFAFSFLGGTFCIIFGVIDLLSQLGIKSEDRDWENGFYLIIMPFYFPVLWWIRYWKFGEYNTLD